MLAVASSGALDARGEVGKIAASAEKSGKTAIAGKGGWYYFVPELKHLSSGKFWGSGGNMDPLPAILDFNAQCKKAGVKLVLVPVPGKASIYPEGLIGKGNGLDQMDQEFFRTLRTAGVNVLDISGKFRSAKNGTPVFCKQDTHWSGTGVNLAAGEIAGLIKRESWYGGVGRSKYSVKAANVSSKGDLGEMARAPGNESIRVFKVTGNATDRNSPVVLLGDSHNLIFSAGGDMVTTGAGLPENLAAQIKFPLDVVAVRGSGATPARINLARRRDNLKGKKMVVWCFTTREFTEGQGWRKVPVVR